MSIEPSKPSTDAATNVKTGDLRVWHIPQVPGDPFHVPVPSAPAAITVLQTLWDYDYFQLEQRIKPDFTNASGLEVYTGDDWEEWYDPTSDEDILQLALASYQPRYQAGVTGQLWGVTATGRIPDRKPDSRR